MKKILLLIAYSFALCTGTLAQSLQQPHLRIKDGVAQLIVSGEPFLVLGGELSNSATSDMNYMKPYWKKLKDYGLNTVIAPVYWELLEPQENEFNFALVDFMINAARRNNLKLVFLWFGTWKNSMSCYVPEWIKTNNQRFKRTQDNHGRSQEILSAFDKEILEADKKAFTALMKHIKATDAKQQTVIMMQVENEIGMLTTAREFSKTADAIYNAPIPKELEIYLLNHKEQLAPELKAAWQSTNFATGKNWQGTFGNTLATQEFFQAWYYAKFANEVASAGKKEYNIPMFVNAALPRKGKLPGEYPSAGPLPHLIDLWKCAAPSIDILSPDFYNPDTKYWCDLYTRKDNPLFIPEIRFDNTCAAKAYFVFGHYKALGFSPFSIETLIDSIPSLKNSYNILHQIIPIIKEKKWLNMDGFLFDKKNYQTQTIMGDYVLNVSHENTLGWAPTSKDSVWGMTGGLIIQTAPDEFIVAGNGIVVTFNPVDSNFVSNILSADEVEYKNNKEIKRKRMNGDQDHQGRHVRLQVGDWGIQKVKLYKSPALINN